jgi:flagellar hook assembly protein FlgD
LWTQSNFRLEIEPHLALPAFMASLPLQYSPAMDPPNKGMQRAQLCSSLNGAALSLVQGDWAGTGPSRGGPLLVSRRGQLASLDLLKTTTNFNFVTVATSGAGKSMFTNEIASDFLAKGGLVRIIDVGRSYMRYCVVNDGVNMVFDPANPQSMNPLWGIENEEQLNQTMTSLSGMYQTSQTVAAAALIGHITLSDGNQMQLSSGKAIAGVELAKDADTVEIKVNDKNGNVVYTEKLTSQKAGVMQFQWDGKNNDGVAQADGTYSINVSAKANGDAVSATPLAYSKVEALSWNNGVPVLHLSNGKEVGADALRQLI